MSRPSALSRHPVDLDRLLRGVHHDGLRVYPTRAATQRRLNGLLEVMRHELLTINPERSFEPHVMAAVAAHSVLFAKKGIRQREIGTSDFGLDSLVPFGGLPLHPNELRHMAEIPLKLIIIDREVAFIPVDASNHERGYVEVSFPPLIQAMTGLFDRIWAHANEFCDPPGLGLSPREQAVVGMLLHGATDSSMARALRISERSITNAVRSLMDRVGAQNRFQLGVALGSIGAVPPPPGIKSAGAGGGGTRSALRTP